VKNFYCLKTIEKMINLALQGIDYLSALYTQVIKVCMCICTSKKVHATIFCPCTYMHMLSWNFEGFHRRIQSITSFTFFSYKLYICTYVCRYVHMCVHMYKRFWQKCFRNAIRMYLKSPIISSTKINLLHQIMLEKYWRLTKRFESRIFLPKSGQTVYL
jgi:hypothetical protein